jgi:L-threonylcarbamoyladenylate synthase
MDERRVLWLENGPGVALAAAAKALAQGRTVLFPTDTVYGLLAQAASHAGYHELYRIKAREQAKPLQLLCPADTALAQHALELLQGHAKARARFAAGGVTLIFDAAGFHGLPLVLQELQPGPVGLRITRYPPLEQLLELTGPPHLLWASSANASGAPPCCLAQEAQAWLAAAALPPAVAVLSSAPCGGRPSAVLRLAGGALHQVR